MATETKAKENSAPKTKKTAPDKLKVISPAQALKAGGLAAYLKKTKYKVPQTLSLGEEFSPEEKLDILNYNY